MDEAEAREQICQVGRWLWEKGYLAAADGNISVRLDNRLLMTPSGLSKGRLKPEQLILTDLEGHLLPGGLPGLRPSSEMRMHATAYRERPDIGAVVHAHPPVTVALSLAGRSMANEYLPEVILTLGCIPTLPYATPTSQANADVIEIPIRTHDAVVLTHHGSLTVGVTLMTAYMNTERVEHAAIITTQALAVSTELRPLPPGEYQKLVAMREAWSPERRICHGGPACPFLLKD
jgi:L-fuculose-phosphate aldolase